MYIILISVIVILVMWIANLSRVIDKLIIDNMELQESNNKLSASAQD